MLLTSAQNGRVSPRTSGSQQSDKNSASPVNSASPNPNEAAKGFATSGSGPGGLVSPVSKSWPQQAGGDSHNLKAARMEAQAMAGGFGGGIPAKIEEVSEPAE